MRPINVISEVELWKYIQDMESGWNQKLVQISTIGKCLSQVFKGRDNELGTLVKVDFSLRLQEFETHGYFAFDWMVFHVNFPSKDPILIPPLKEDGYIVYYDGMQNIVPINNGFRCGFHSYSASCF